ncbi:MAG: hypothetical protein KC493_11110, partial [Bacteriovoracaceae bacterium]|nr:hypothetical protein [Bacteriovoracaceae bacterium]
LKMILNIHSTLVMGRLERYESNIMTWVKSSNNKLIDRSARNIDYLLKEKGLSFSYQEIVYKIFEKSEELRPNQSIVLECVNALSLK